MRRRPGHPASGISSRFLPGSKFLTAAAGSISVPDHGLDFEQTVSQFERSILMQAMEKTAGNKKQAADMLGLKRTTLSAKLRTLDAA